MTANRKRGSAKKVVVFLDEKGKLSGHALTAFVLGLKVLCH